MPHLTHDQRAAIEHAALPLAPRDRQPFIADVVAALDREPLIGPGNLHRAIVAAQRAHFDPPSLNGNSGVPRPRFVSR